MTGLAEVAEKTLTARGVECPSCGAALEVKLATTQSIVCHQCHAVVDVSQGVGGDLQHYAQANGGEPQIPLGSVGTLALGGKRRAAVAGGRLRRALRGAGGCRTTSRCSGASTCSTTAPRASPSWSTPRTAGAGPRRSPACPSVRRRSCATRAWPYRKLYSYTGKVTYVLGEFYWRLQRDQLTRNTDYEGTGAGSDKRLNREQTGGDGTHEVVWSAGETLDAPTRCCRPSGWRRDARPRRCSATRCRPRATPPRCWRRSSSGASSSSSC